MTIQQAGPADSYSIFRVFIAEAEGKSDVELESGEYYQKWAPVFLEMLENSFLKVFVALDDNRIAIGVVTVYLLPRLELAGKYAVVEDVYVKESERSHGVGSALFEEIFRFLKSERVRFVSASVDPANLQAQNFYQKLGFSQDGLQMRREII